jgi:hypothetical protein
MWMMLTMADLPGHQVLATELTNRRCKLSQPIS